MAYFNVDYEYEQMTQPKILGGSFGKTLKLGKYS